MQMALGDEESEVLSLLGAALKVESLSGLGDILRLDGLK
jgi:hypothetical protein